MPAPPLTRASSTARLVAVAVGGATAAFRLLTFSALENDHYVVLARAHQVLAGDLPVLDFEDPGYPLTYLLSALAAHLFGPSLAVEAVLDIVVVSIAAALTVVLAHHASGSLIVALAAAAVEVALYPRLYNAPKLFVPIAAIAFGWRYSASPTTTRLLALGVWTGLAFLVRHDFILYIGAASLVLIRGTGGDTATPTRRRIAIYAIAVTAVVLPWVVYVQWAAGVPAYVASAARFTLAEAQRTGGGTSAPFYALVLLPVVVLAMSGRPGGRGDGRPPLAPIDVRFAAALSLLMNLVFLRDVVWTRLPDVAGLAVLLLAWLAGRLVRSRILAWTGAAVLAASAAVVALALARQGYGVPMPADVIPHVRRVADRMADDGRTFDAGKPATRAAQYVKRCTAPSARVLVGGFAPEIPVLAGRPFAGGVPDFLPGYYESPVEVERTIARLERRPPAVAIMMEGSAPFVTKWPAVAAWLRARGFEERDGARIGPGITVWARPGEPSDPDTGLPCVGREDRR
jgi:hypothetical protein